MPLRLVCSRSDGDATAVDIKVARAMRITERAMACRIFMEKMGNWFFRRDSGG
jgi:hypothetical protein